MSVEFRPVTDLPRVGHGDPLGPWLAGALEEQFDELSPGDVLCVAQKVVSKAEHPPRTLDDYPPSRRARRLADTLGRDAREVLAQIDNSSRIDHAEAGLIIAETTPGFVCANAGVDRSNLEGEDRILPLPADPDDSARRIRGELEAGLDAGPAVLVTDTWGRPWRRGQRNVAIGLAGLDPFRDHRGETDDHGRPLRRSLIAVADEIAGGAELVMGKSRGIPAVIVTGLSRRSPDGRGARALIRPEEDDFFR